MKSILTCLVAAISTLSFSLPVQAVVLFADNFENATGPFPAPPDMPQAGAWHRIGNESHVIDSGGPGAHGGSKYLWIDRPTLSQFGNVGTSDGVTIAGTPIHAEFWMNVVEGYAAFGLNTGPGNNILIFRPLLYAVPDAENTVGRYVPANVDPNEFLPTGLNYQNDIWQKYELDFVLGSSQVTLKVDGTPVTVEGPFGISPSPTIDAVYGWTFTPASSTASFYVDDVLIEAEIPETADFDGDSDVDGADFLIWQRGIGTSEASPSNGDANGDAMVDAADFGIWRDQFGTIGLALSIPEPNSFIGLLVLLPAAIRRRESRPIGSSAARSTRS